MDLNNNNKEILSQFAGKLFTAVSAEKLMEFAKVNGVELSEEEEKVMLESKKVEALSDDELQDVSGGATVQMNLIGSPIKPTGNLNGLLTDSSKTLTDGEDDGIANIVIKPKFI